MTTQSEAYVFPLDAHPKGNGNRWAGLLEVFQAFHRWQQGPVDYLKQEFFGRPASGLCALRRDYPPRRHLLIQHNDARLIDPLSRSGERGSMGCPERIRHPNYGQEHAGIEAEAAGILDK